MKKLLSIILIAVLLLGAAPVFADDSFTDNDVRFINATWINFEEEYSIWKVILTSYNKRNSVNDELSSIIRRQITEDLDNAALEADDLAGYLSTDTVKYSVQALFDLTVTDNTVKLVESKPGIKLRLTVDVNLNSDSFEPVVLHYSDSSAKEWQIVDESDVWLGKDASLTVQLDSFCPVLVLIPEEIPAAAEAETAKPITPVQDTSAIVSAEVINGDNAFHIEPALIIVLLISLLWLISSAIVLDSIERKKTTRISLAAELIKLKAEMMLAGINGKASENAEPKVIIQSEDTPSGEPSANNSKEDDPLYLDTDSWFK